ncbi:hypothetical protein GOB87_15160 [Acetobacter estunensis]|uniref:Uncharacterized protein n=1 Tax=Acetobacter estunensis TaxID=104097 RepID=A0A967B8V1_9PROT|nr:hypothetical protein [Acetobacter estunensis]NHO55259.1 hypothetical protein [Acetobacter estunensis]
MSMSDATTLMKIAARMIPVDRPEWRGPAISQGNAGDEPMMHGFEMAEVKSSPAIRFARKKSARSKPLLLTHEPTSESE